MIGFDNQAYIADGLYPGLSTMALPHYEMGVWGVAHLLDLIDGRGDRAGTASPARLPCPLIRRSSVGPPPEGPPAAT